MFSYSKCKQRTIFWVNKKCYLGSWVICLGFFDLCDFLVFGVVCLGEVGFLVGLFSSFKFGKTLDIGKSEESEICVCDKGYDGICALISSPPYSCLFFFCCCCYCCSFKFPFY